MRAACNCAQRMRQQATGSNPMSESIICPSIRLYGRLRAFCDFMLVCLVVRVPFWNRMNVSRLWTPKLEINTNIFPFWGLASRFIYFSFLKTANFVYYYTNNLKYSHSYIKTLICRFLMVL